MCARIVKKKAKQSTEFFQARILPALEKTLELTPVDREDLRKQFEKLFAQSRCFARLCSDDPKAAVEWFESTIPEVFR